IHAMSGEQDMRKMGGLKKHLPITFKTFFIATLAIAGIFPFAGFFSKDEILWHAFNKAPVLWGVGLLAAAGTAVYMFRLVTLTFFGECRADEKTQHHIHESPRTMTVPLIILAFLSIAGGFLGIPESLGGHHSHLLERWLEPVFVAPAETSEMMSHGFEYLLMVLSLGIAMAGCYAGFILYSRKKEIPEGLSRRFPLIYQFVLNKYYVDEFYQIFFVNNLLRLNNFLARFDMKVIDGIVNLSAYLTKMGAFFSGWFDRTFVDGAVNLSASVTSWGGMMVRRVQSGKIQVYLYYAIGAILLIMLYRFL
ncbi:MAG: NADH-quinone oxidoreductase subunit L, partial [Deltaproteobacteria bacterium]|nr:NADH-quinone oxidoreductase subunit L [Deltaproteobacteria bacterium]